MPINTTGLRALCWSLLYGVDKIPDQWFEKVPGGYYKNTEGREQARPEQARQSQKKHGKDKRRPHREYDDDNDGYRSEGEQYARDQRGRRGHNYEDDGYGDTRGGRDRARSMGDRDYGGQAGYSRQRGYNQGDFAQDDGDDDYAGRSGHDNRYVSLGQHPPLLYTTDPSLGRCSRRWRWCSVSSTILRPPSFFRTGCWLRTLRRRLWTSEPESISGRHAI